MPQNNFNRQSFDATEITQQVGQSPCSTLQQSTADNSQLQNMRNFNPIDPFDDSVDQQVKQNSNRASEPFGKFDDFPKDQVGKTNK